MKMIIVRHGQTNFNKRNRLQGHIESELTEEGILQSYSLKESLKNTVIDLIISSPLSRTKKLAEIINEDRNLPLLYDDRLMERSYGGLEGLYGNNINISNLWNIDMNLSDNNVESVISFLDRMKSFLQECEKKYDKKSILLVTHSGNSIAANYYYNGLPRDNNLLKLGLKNCEIAEYSEDWN